VSQILTVAWNVTWDPVIARQNRLNLFSILRIVAPLWWVAACGI